MSDRIFGIIGLLIAAAYAWQAKQIHLSFISDNLGPKAFPWLIAAAIAICSLYILIRPEISQGWPIKNKLFKIFIVIFSMIVYAWSLEYIGFVLATTFLSAFLAWQLGATIKSSLIFGCAISIAVFVLFHLVLGLTMAKGPWGF